MGFKATKRAGKSSEEGSARPSTFLKKLYSLSDTLFEVTQVSPSFFEVVKQKKGAKVPAYLPEKLRQFYSEIGQCNFEWEHVEFPDTPWISGSVKILPLSEVDRTWEGVVWFAQAPVLPEYLQTQWTTHGNRHFKIFDFFLDETVVGFYDDRSDDCLYLYYMQGEPVSLQLDIEGYIDMMVASLGFVGWQVVLVSLIESNENYPTTITFREQMPQLQSGFDWEEYKARFERNRLPATKTISKI